MLLLPLNMELCYYHILLLETKKNTLIPKCQVRVEIVKMLGRTKVILWIDFRTCSTHGCARALIKISLKMHCFRRNLNMTKFETQ